VTGLSPLASASTVDITSPAAGDRLHFNGTEWVNGREPYIIGAFIGTTLVASQIVLFHAFAESTTLAANFGTTEAGAESLFQAGTTATNAATLTAQKCLSSNDPTNPTNWATVGDIVWSAGGHLAAGATNSGSIVTFAQGDMMWLHGGTTADPTLSLIGLTIALDR
jgi:hypothetical protein